MKDTLELPTANYRLFGESDTVEESLLSLPTLSSRSVLICLFWLWLVCLQFSSQRVNRYFYSSVRQHIYELVEPG